MKNFKKIFFTLPLLFILAGCANTKPELSQSNTGNLIDENENEKNIEQIFAMNGKKMTMYKSPNCGCCVGYADEMKKQGVNVEVVSIDDMSIIKEKYGILADKQSCHTTVVDDYFIEGHVPIEAVEKLLLEKPDIDGIGLPRMPSGTPGMPGQKHAPYEIYQSTDGEFSDYITI